jgi:hypothetical protein
MSANWNADLYIFAILGYSATKDIKWRYETYLLIYSPHMLKFYNEWHREHVCKTRKY